jgi:hypothetical protein
VTQFEPSSSSDIAGLASLGAVGKYGNNVERDFHRWARNAHGLDFRERIIKLQVMGPDAMTQKEISFPVLPPSTIVKNMWEFSPDMFRKNMFGNQSLAMFWSAAYDHGFIHKHPHAPRSRWASAIPFTIHGDGARAFKNQKLLILSWAPVLIRGCSWDTRMLYCVVPYDLLISGITLQQLLAAFRDDVNELQRGENAGPWRFAFFGSKGDLEWQQQAYSLRHYYRCNLLCSRCFASQSDKHPELLYTDVSDDAGWMSTMIDTEAFLRNAAMHGGLPPLCEIDGWTAQSLIWDSMHNVFAGICPDIIGACLQLLCEHHYYGELLPDEQLKFAHASLREFYRKRNAPCGVPMFDSSNTSNMAGTKWYASCDLPKATHAKLVLFWLADELYTASVLGVEVVMQALASTTFENMCTRETI